MKKYMQELKRGACVLLCDGSSGQRLLISAARECTPELLQRDFSEAGLQPQLVLSRSHATRLGLTVDKKTSSLRFEPEHLPVRAGNVFDEARAISLVASEDAYDVNLVSPGGLQAQIVEDGGCLLTGTVTAAALDVVRLAGAGVLALCAILPEDYQPEKSLLKMTLQDIIDWRFVNEPLVERVNSVNMPTEYGEFRMHVYRTHFDPARGIDLVLTFGDDSFQDDEIVTVRIHSEWSILNIVNRLGNEEGSHLNRCMQKIAKKGRGAVIFLRNTPEQAAVSRLARGEKVPPDLWSEKGELKTLKAGGGMNYGIGAQILRDLGIRKLILLSNSTGAGELNGIDNYGIEIQSRENY